MRRWTPIFVASCGVLSGVLLLVGSGRAQIANATPEPQGPESIAFTEPIFDGGEDPVLRTVAEGAHIFHATINTTVRKLRYSVKIGPDFELSIPSIGVGKTDVWVALQPIDPHYPGLSVAKSLKVSISSQIVDPGQNASTSDYRIIDNPFRGNRPGTYRAGTGWKVLPLIGTDWMIKQGPAVGGKAGEQSFGVDPKQAQRPVECDLVVSETR